MQVYEMEKIMTEISNILEEDVGAFDRDEAADVMDLIFDLREKQTYFTPDLHKTLYLGRVQRNKMAVSMSHRQQRGMRELFCRRCSCFSPPIPPLYPPSGAAHSICPA